MVSVFLAFVAVLLAAAGAGADIVVGWGRQKPPGCALTNLTKIAAGGWHSLALKADGSIVGWGWNIYGQATPAAGTDFVAIAAGNWHSLALKRGPCPYHLAGDLDDNCRVDLVDISILAGNWLVDCNLEPFHPACVAR